MFQHVGHRLSLGMIQSMLEEFFGMRIFYSEIHMFKELMARYYRATYRSLLATILTGNLLHVDETEVKLQTGKGYVWVFTNLEEVVFMYRPTKSPCTILQHSPLRQQGSSLARRAVLQPNRAR